MTIRKTFNHVPEFMQPDEGRAVSVEIENPFTGQLEEHWRVVPYTTLEDVAREAALEVIYEEQSARALEAVYLPEAVDIHDEDDWADFADFNHSAIA